MENEKGITDEQTPGQTLTGDYFRRARTRCAIPRAISRSSFRFRSFIPARAFANNRSSPRSRPFAPHSPTARVGSFSFFGGPPPS